MSKPRPRFSKFGNKRTEVDGITFASKAEAKRYSELKLLEKCGAIRRLELQPRFAIEVDGMKICSYVADFAYYTRDIEGALMRVVEDVKGFITPEFRLKKKLMKACYGIEITEIGGGKSRG